MTYQPQFLLKRLVTANLVLVAISAGLLVLVLAYQEAHLPEFRGPAFLRYLLESGLETRTFTTGDERIFVPQAELYDPFPESSALLQIPLEVLSAVRSYEKSCRESDFERADAESRARSLSPSKLLDWHRAVCSGKLREFRLWLERAPFVHPSGVSYAKLFSEAARSQGLDESRGAGLEKYFHFRERAAASEFDLWFSDLSFDEQKAFGSGFQALVVGRELAVAGDWNGSSRKVLIFSLSVVADSLRRVASFEVAPIDRSSGCDFLQYGLCFSKADEALLSWKSRWLRPVLIGLVAFGLSALGTSILILRGERRRREAEQALLFQIISHELRTPMTAIQLSAEGFRQQFDRLDSKGQQHLLKLLDAFYDLDKIVSRTLKELKNENEAKVFDLVRAASAIIENKYAGLVEFVEPEEPVMVRFSDFWFEICLSNLIRNAFLHGKPPVIVRVRAQGSVAQVEVQDSGEARSRDLRSFARVFFRTNSKLGLGIGLRIVSRKMQDAGGRLIAQASPTRFILQFKREGEE